MSQTSRSLRAKRGTIILRDEKEKLSKFLELHDDSLIEFSGVGIVVSAASGSPVVEGDRVIYHRYEAEDVFEYEGEKFALITFDKVSCVVAKDFDGIITCRNTRKVANPLESKLAMRNREREIARRDEYRRRYEESILRQKLELAHLRELSRSNT